MQRLKKIGFYLFILLSLLILMLTLFQEKLIFLPTKLPQDYHYSFEHDFEEIFLKTDDGANLNALHFKTEEPKGLLLYFHGNAGDLSKWGHVVAPFVDLGYDVLVMDYRNYGKSTGKLSEEGLYNDAQLFYDYAKKEYPADKIVIYGRSMGASIATQLASRNKAKKLLLETPFYSLLDVAQDRFPLLPIKQLLKYKMPSFKYIRQVRAPIRIFHGTADDVVSYKSGKKLFDSIPGHDKKMYPIEGGNHNNLIEFGSFQEAIRQELE